MAPVAFNNVIREVYAALQQYWVRRLAKVWAQFRVVQEYPNLLLEHLFPTT